jgi:hypothetical protein
MLKSAPEWEWETMSEWWVHLQGDNTDFAQLSAVLTSPDFAIQRRNGHYFLRSTHLNKLEDVRKVQEAANAMLQPLNGLTRLMVRTSKFLTVGNLERFDDEGKTHYTMLTGSGIYAIQGSVVGLGGDGTTKRAQQQDPLPSLLALSQTDEELPGCSVCMQRRCNPGRTCIQSMNT